ncbi:DUF302 domain-containing protein [Thiocystis minor]|uniref:DUF302 domain-containing protein n=1 Tax=Thiocystis minor TaxID=61597 RepID=UPI001913861F|nr:DUF302 domain-containing protein [Thiocystis minor]MBK5966052.1 DUF302 domain-containing protein [Thiocystis minor]
MLTRSRLLAVLLLIGYFLPSASAADRDDSSLYRSDAAFEDVLEGLKAAILERGLYINNVMDMGEMLERTGKDLGMQDPLYLQAKNIEFCSAVLSREMTREDPSRIVNCPFIVSVYTLPEQPGITYVAHRKIPLATQESSASMAGIAAMLQAVSEAAVSW